ncbi:MAG: hypothetical protein ACYDGR_12860 [Candidatus Dormibacteria bacterium]
MLGDIAGLLGVEDELVHLPAELAARTGAPAPVASEFRVPVAHG